MTKILIPVEDKLYGEALIEFLSERNFPTETEFYLMVVVKPLALQDFGYAIPRAYFDPLIHEDEKLAATLLEDMETKLKQKFPSSSVTKIIEYGGAAQEILKESKDRKVDWIVMGSHGRSGLDKFFLGSVSQAVANRAHCSVTVVRVQEMLAQQSTSKDSEQVKAEPDNAYRILVPLEELSFAEAQIEHICKQSLPDNAQIELLNVTRPITVYDYSDAMPPSFFEELSKEDDKLSDLLLNESAKKLKAKFPNTKIEKIRMFGDPKAEILKQASEDKVKWIVLGSHGRSGFDKFFLGSVSQAVVNRAECSVTVVRLGYGVEQQNDKNKELATKS